MIPGLRPRFNSKSYTLITAPASEPVSLADVKLFVKEDGSENDAILTMLIASARRMAEEYTKRALITQTWKLTMDAFGDYEATEEPGYLVGPSPMIADGSTVQLSRQPIASITDIKTRDGTGTQTTVATATYTLDTAGGRILLNDGYSWPTSLRAEAAIEITFVAGWTEAALVPAPIKQAIMQTVAASYSSRVCADMPAGAKTLLDGFRLPEAYGAW